MKKEIIIIISIIVLVVTANIITQNYIKNCVKDVNVELISLRDDLLEENVDKENVQKKINDVHDKWDEMTKKLLYYIKHEDLEKVEIQLSSTRGMIDVGMFDQSIPELDKCVFILNNIKDKESIKLKNIF